MQGSNKDADLRMDYGYGEVWRVRRTGGVGQSLTQPHISQTGTQSAYYSSWEADMELEANPGQDLLLIAGDGPRAHEGRDHGGKCLWRKTRQPQRQGDTAESHAESGAIIASLSHQHR